MALPDEKQEKVAEQVGHIDTRTSQLITKVDRLEGAEKERAVAQKRRDDASAARERVLVEGMKTLAGSVGVDPKTIERLVTEAFEKITLTFKES